MPKNRLSKVSRYEEIASDIAKKIVANELTEGRRIHGRSTLAAHYHVSPETIRRALRLLQDHDVVDVVHGSGIRIISQENAQSYLVKVQTQLDFFALHDKLGKLIAERDKLNHQINAIYSQIFAAAVGYMGSPRQLSDFEINEDSVFYGQELDPVKVWVDQGLTVVSVKRGDEVIPPYKAGIIKSGDILMVIK